MADLCAVENPDMPGAYSCEYPAGHARIWRYGAWQDHGAPSQNVWWVVPPYTEDEVAAVTFVLNRAKENPHVEALLMQELVALGWAVGRADLADADTNEMAIAALTHGSHAAPIDRPEYRAAGYTVYEPPRNLR